MATSGGYKPAFSADDILDVLNDNNSQSGGSNRQQSRKKWKENAAKAAATAASAASYLFRGWERPKTGDKGFSSQANLFFWPFISWRTTQPRPF